MSGFSVPPVLRNRRYLLLLIGLLAFYAGSQMQLSALFWHIRILTGEPQPLALGGIGLARILPIFLLSIISGPVADTFNRRKILFFTQSTMMGIALLLAVLTYLGKITIWQIYLLSALQAGAMAFDIPARQAMIPSLVPARDIPNAFSLSSIVANVGAITGPALSGVIIATLGQEYTYLFNAMSFLVIMLALLLIGPVQQAGARSGINLSAVKDGIRFILSKPVIFSTMLIDFVATFFASATTMLPIIAKDILKVGELGYGWLASSQAIGSLTAGLIISQVKELRRQGLVFLLAVFIFGAATIAFGAAGTFAISVAALIVMGAADTVSTIIRNTIRQLNTPDQIRGRMVALNQLFFQGGPQLGEVEAGIVATLLGVPFAIISGGIACIIGTGLIVIKWPQLRSYNGDEHLLVDTISN